MKPYTIYVIIYGAKGLKSKSGKHKFCVEAKINKAKQKSELIEDLFGNPTFNKEFIFPIDGLNNELKLKVKEKNDKDILGQVKIQITDLQQFKSDTPERAPLRPHKKCPNPSGELLFDAWVTGVVDPASLNFKKKTISIESLKSLSGLKKIKEKFHSSALKLHGKHDDGDDDDANVEKKKKSKLFSLKNRGAVSCQDLSTSKKGITLFHGKALEKKYLDPNVQNASPGGSIENLSNDLFKPFSRNANTGADVMIYKLSAPEVTGLSPKIGHKKGGTTVTIRGSNLGENINDLLHVYVCGVDMIKNTRYVSSSKLICTTLPCQPCTGNVIIETKFGGLGSSTVEFSFTEEEDKKLNSDYEEIKLVTDRELGETFNRLPSSSSKDNDSIDSSDSGSVFKNRNLDIIRESSSDESAEELSSFGPKVTTVSSKTRNELRETGETFSNVGKVYGDKYENKFLSKSDKIVLSNKSSNGANHARISGTYSNKIVKLKDMAEAEKKNEEEKIDKEDDDDYSVLVNKLHRASIDAQKLEQMTKGLSFDNKHNNFSQKINVTNEDDFKYAKNIPFNDQGTKNEETNSTIFKPTETKTSHISVQLIHSPDANADRAHVIRISSKNSSESDKTDDILRVDTEKAKATFRISQGSSSDDDFPAKRTENPPVVVPSTSLNINKIGTEAVNFKSEITILNTHDKKIGGKSNDYDESNDDNTYRLVDEIVTGKFENTANYPEHNQPLSTTSRPAINEDFSTVTMRDKSSIVFKKNSDDDLLSRKSLIDLNISAFPKQPDYENEDINTTRTSDYYLERKVVEIQPLSHNSNDSKNNLLIRSSSSKNSLNSLNMIRNNSSTLFDDLSSSSQNFQDSPSGISNDESPKTRKKIIPDLHQFDTNHEDHDTPPVKQRSALSSNKAVPESDDGYSPTEEKPSGNLSIAPIKPPRLKDFIDFNDKNGGKKFMEPPHRHVILSNSNESYELDNNDVALMKENNNNRRQGEVLNSQNCNTAVISHFKESEKSPTSSSSLSSSTLTTTNVKLNFDNDSDIKMVFKKLMSDLEAREETLRELQLRNKSLQEERDLLRRYIEVLISRALSTCPEILSRDDKKISFK